VERLVLFRIKAFDWNCPQHINPRYTIEEFKELISSHPELLKVIVKGEHSAASDEAVPNL
jgi:hypothetical protein